MSVSLRKCNFLLSYKVTFKDTVMVFADEKDMEEWSLTAICAASELGIVIGKGNGIFDPEGAAKRSEAAKV